MTKMTTCLWFDRGKAREAAEFYASVFPDSQVGEGHASAADNPSAKAGEELTVEFTVLGQAFIGLNGKPNGTSPSKSYRAASERGVQYGVDRGSCPTRSVESHDTARPV